MRLSGTENGVCLSSDLLKNQKDFGINFGINETQQKIIAKMIANSQITAGTLAEIIGVSKRQIESDIGKLKSMGILRREGSRKSGRWIVIAEKNAEDE